jgi:hypothetical protein
MFLSKHRDKAFCVKPRQTVSQYIMLGTEWKLRADSEFQMHFLEEKLLSYEYLWYRVQHNIERY